MYLTIYSVIWKHFNKLNVFKDLSNVLQPLRSMSMRAI